MKKKKAIRNFILIGIATIIGLVLSFCSFDIPWTTYTYTGFVGGIQLGLDLKGGVVAVYDATASDNSSDFDAELEATIARITTLIQNDYSEATITKQGTNQIRIEVPDVDNPDDILSMIGEPASIEFCKYVDSDHTKGDMLVDGTNIKNVEAAKNSTTWGVSIKFDSTGSDTLAGVTKGDKIDIFIGGTYFNTVEVQDAITSGETFISGGSISDQTTAEAYALKILSGTYSVDLSLSEKSVTSATLGEDALFYGILAGAIGLALIFIFMCLVYGLFGLMADFALVIYTIIVLGCLAIIPSVQLTLPGIAGIILGLGMAVDANVIIFERIKDEYRLGKRVGASIKSGFRKSLSAILDSNITTILASIVLIIFGTGSIKGFAITLLISILVSMFCGLLVTRALVYNLNNIVGNSPKKYKLKREDNVNEIE